MSNKNIELVGNNAHGVYDVTEEDMRKVTGGIIIVGGYGLNYSYSALKLNYERVLNYEYRVF